MLVNALKPHVLRILRVPPEPADPLGGQDSLLVFRAAPNFLRYKLFAWAIGQVFTMFGLIVGLIVLRVVASKTPEPWNYLLLIAEFFGIIFTFGQLIFSYLVVVLDYEQRWYKVTDRSLRIREGVLFVREMTMTFANIQNLSITQGPLQRALGIADLKVQTAGGGGSAEGHHGGDQPGVFNMHVGYFRGVDNAERIRDMMRERLRLQRDAGLGDTDDHHVDAPGAEPVAVQASADMQAVIDGLRAEAAAFRAAAERLAARGRA